MTSFICMACGVQYPPSIEEPEHCPVCEDERQYVRAGGQAWTTMDELAAAHRNRFYRMEARLTRVGTVPSFAIGQCAYLVQTEQGNLLWDCITLLDAETTSLIKDMGGIDAIALSHPHFYSAIAEWSAAFGDAPVYLHSADRAWVMHEPRNVQYWTEPTRQVLPGLTLIHAGGHFAGSALLHWADGAEGKGALLTGDTIQVAMDPNWVSWMYSYPNLIPLSIAQVDRVIAATDEFAFDRLHSPWLDRTVQSGAKDVIRRSRDRYVAALSGAHDW